MIRRRFGRTELSMPVFSCGGMRYQHRWQDLPLSEIPADNQANLERVIQRALEHGINHIETARGYGSSERQLGQVLPSLPRQSLIVQTKVSPQADSAQFERDFNDSLARLRLDYVDLLAIHGVNTAELMDFTLRPGGCFEIAQRLRERGKVRFVGFSTHASLPVILRGIRHGQASVGQGFDFVNLHWYFIFQRNWPAILEAARRDMGVFIISPSDKGGRLYSPPASLVELCRPLSPMVFNDLFCLSHPQVHTLSIGASRPSDFDEHLKALAHLSRAEAVLKPILQRLGEAMRSATGDPDPECFSAGMPEYDELPHDYNLSAILWLFNLARGWGLWDYARWRFGMLDNADHWFAGNRPRSVEEVNEAELLAALPRHGRRDEVPGLLKQAVQLLGGVESRRLSQS